ncbi:cytospin-A [Drosophila kikkawai]|uniref:Cytospin-A n=1 Tax=Drosophila kikkawai TaxID=30033 RepID=A0ABM3C4D5_DROKI|nr:uncharacterized protein LOC108071391 [Drosophila kikkawai]
MMEALLAEIKSTVASLENDSEPEELHMRACMGKTVKLMKDLRNSIVETGHYSELFTSRTSKVLAECRTLMGFLYRSVPCHAEGGKVPAEAQRCFLQVMDVVIGQFDDIIKESQNKQNSGDPDSQNEIRKELKEVIHQNLTRFKKLTASAIQASKRGCKIDGDLENKLSSEHLESAVEPQKIKEQKEELKVSQKGSQPELDVSRRDRGDAKDIHSPNLKNSHLSPSQIPDCRPEEIRLEHLPQSGEDISKAKSTERQPYLLAQTSATLSDFILKDQSEKESNIEIVDSYQNIKGQTSLKTESQDLKDFFVQKEPTKSNSSDLIFKDHSELESNVEIVDSRENIKDKTSLRTETKDLQVLWAQKEKTKYNSSDSLLKDQSELKSNVERVDSQQKVKSQTSMRTEGQDLQVLWVQREKTKFNSSNCIFKDQSELKSNEKRVDSQQNIKGQTRLRSQSQDLQDLSIQKEQSRIKTKCNASDFILKDQTELESNAEIVDSQQKVKSQRSLRTESQDLQVLCDQKEQPRIQIKRNSSDFKLKDQSELKSNVSMVGSNQNIKWQPSLKMENRQDLQVLWVQKEQPVLQTSSTSSDFKFDDQTQTSLTTESSQDFQILLNQTDDRIIETSFSSSCIESLRDVPVLKELESNMACSGSIQNHIGLLRTCRKDLPFLSVQEDKPLIRTSFTSPGFLLKDVLHPENDKIKARLTSKSSQDQQAWAQTDNPMLKGSSSFDFSIKKTNSYIKNIKSRQIDNPLTQKLNSSKVTLQSQISAETSSPNNVQLPLTRPQRNRNTSIKKKLSANNFFAVGKTFGNTRLRLLRWCQERTRKYGLPMYEFSESWRSGRALVALIASYHKDLIEERFLNKESPRSTLTYGANVAKSLGVDSEVDIVQVCRQKVPDFCQVCAFVDKLERCLVPRL